MSPQMGVGYLFERVYTMPALVELTVTPDGHLHTGKRLWKQTLSIAYASATQQAFTAMWHAIRSICSLLRSLGAFSISI